MSEPAAPSDELSRKAFALLDAASHLEPAAAKEAVRASCLRDPALLAEAMSILGAAERQTTPVDRPVFPDLGNYLTEVFEAAKTEDPMPARIGPYRIESELGRGGSAVVLQAVQDGPGRAVALKVLMRLPARDAMRRFRAEVAALARLSHPGIAAIYDAGTHDFPWGASPWIAMELVPGKPITTYARESGLNWRQAVALAGDACEAVAHAHLRGVMHLDLKPGNIFVLPPEGAGGTARVKVLDFGLARFTTPMGDESVSLGGPIGTVAYASPEQLSRSGPSEGEVDARADVYSLGIVLHEMIRGGPIFDTQRYGMADVVRAITTGQMPAPVRADGGRVPPELAAVILRATSLRREDRYRSAAELGDDLQRVLRGEPVSARPLGWAYRARCLARTRPALASGVVVGVLGMAGAVGGTGYGMMRALANERMYKEQRDTLLALVQDIAYQGDIETDDRRFGEARRWREAVVRVLRDLSAREPHDVSLAADLSIAIVKVGDLDKAQFDYAKARERYLEALEIDRGLCTRRPRDRRLADNLVRGYTRLAWLHEAEKDFAGAAPWADLAVDGAEGLRQLAPDNALSTHACIEALLLCGRLADKAGDRGAAAGYAQRAWAYAGELRKGWKMDAHLAAMCVQAARALREFGAVADGTFLEITGEMLPEVHDAIDDYSADVELVGQAAVLLVGRARALGATGSPMKAAEEALAVGRLAMKHWRARLNGPRGPDDVESAAASVHILARAAEVIEQFTDPGDPERDRMLALALVRTHPRLRRDAEAVALARRVAEGTDPGNPASWLVLAECYLARGDPAAAGEALARGEELGGGDDPYCIPTPVLRQRIGAARDAEATPGPAAR